MDTSLSYNEIISKVRMAFEHADARNIFEHIAIQINMVGENGGVFYIEIANRQICVEPYDYYDKDGLITTTPETIVEIAEGKLDFETALNDEKLTIAGDLRKLKMLKLIELPSLESVKKKYQKIENNFNMNQNEKSQEIIRNLEAARRNRELCAYYQPQYDAITGKIVGAEALIRWIKKDGTMILPGDFIPELEKTNRICDIDWFILEEACILLKDFEKKHISHMPIAVNFSRKHVSEQGFIRKLCGIVDNYNLPHKYIEVEITETAYMEHPELITDWINHIKEKGFKVAIDDFGSGLSSLSLLADINADILKIDRSLIKNNCENEKQRIILESIFDFAHRLSLTTIAEGVETDFQLSFMRTCDCQYIQGYLFSKPLSSEKFTELCKHGLNIKNSGDILTMQSTSGAMNLLLKAVFQRYPLVIFSNLTRNSYYMMAYENFSATTCPATGCFDDLIKHGTATMHPDDMKIFETTFKRENLLKCYKNGDTCVKAVTRQIGDDGTYRKVETSDYFVKHPSVDDVLVITFCQNI